MVQTVCDFLETDTAISLMNIVKNVLLNINTVCKFVIETHSKTLKVVKRDVWKKDNIVKNARAEYKMLGQFADGLITASLSKK